jgi:hypothetical protein
MYQYDMETLASSADVELTGGVGYGYTFDVISSIIVDEVSRVYTMRLYNVAVDDIWLINNNASDNVFKNEIAGAITTDFDLRGQKDGSSILYGDIYVDNSAPVISGGSIASGDDWISEFKLSKLEDGVIKILANAAVYDGSYYLNSGVNELAAIYDGSYYRNSGVNELVAIIRLEDDSFDPFAKLATIKNLIEVTDTYRGNLTITNTYQILRIDGYYLYVIRMIFDTGISFADTGLSIRGSISDSVNASNSITFDGDNTSSVKVSVDNTFTDINYQQPVSGRQYQKVNTLWVEDPNNAKSIFDQLKAIIDSTIAANCGNPSDTNNVDCHYDVRVENLFPLVIGADGSASANLGVTYSGDSKIYLRVKLEKFEPNTTFDLTYNGMTFTCTKDGNMYADCTYDVNGGNVGVTLGGAAAVSGDNTIYIDEDKSYISGVIGLPDGIAEGYLNGVFSAESIGALLGNGANYFNTVFYVTVYAIDRAGNVSEDTRVIHFISSDTLVAATTSGVSASSITQGVSFVMPNISAGVITDVLRGHATALNEYILEYTLDDKVVDSINTNYTGRYKVYVKANIDGKEVRELVYTLDVTSGYVEIENIKNNYTVLIISVLLGVIFLAGCIYISRKKEIL